MSATARSRRLTVVAAAAGIGLLAGPLALTQGALADDHSAARAAAPAAVQHGKWRVKVDLYALNDFHGQLEAVDPQKSSGGRVGSTVAGGAEYLATHLKEWRAASKDRGAQPITVAAGDLIGATPLLSAAFHDEPTIQAMNLMGLQVTSVGNHEFDEGSQELLRMQNGGCLADGDGANNQNSCPDPANPFEGADFQYLAANVKDSSTNKTILPPYWVKKVNGEKVGFIGMTLQNTPNIVTKSGVAGLEFTDEVATVNKLVPVLRKQGVQAMVVLLHEGVTPSSTANVNGCEGAEGPGLEIAKNLDPEIDLVVSGHTHQPYICTVRDPHGRQRMITSAFSTGRVVTEINLQIKRRNGEVVRSAVRATNHIVTNPQAYDPAEAVDPQVHENINPDTTVANAAITRLIARYKELVRPIESKVLGKIAPADAVNTLAKVNDGTDYPLGNLIADSQKHDPSAIPSGGATPVVAFMNPGGIRTNLVENDQGDVTYGAAFAVQPFNNYVTSVDLTGQQILDVLNQQWNGLNEGTLAKNAKILQVSGLQYSYSAALAETKDADALVGDVLIDENGDGNVTELLDKTKTYRVVANSFLTDGGDGFATLGQGANKFIGGLDIDALARELTSGTGAYQPPAEGRITKVS
ncbi:bifunctional metallophosphatase/5'-nucleotidase [Nocardioides mesophilus]|uniref:Bifunctional metallophosphatase/5'-nucleotidase n=1 Tax=Nocardioides mesophilus TaxID=433659 RepID=A0A7G9RFJ4_9ACTN|nr:bifunctional metallophosphatase/5'-nucleotidase [Nocardioides mesophilus]QNN54369.1 bifunctional metallophosphatase/5'-nucleotidase [Nocardioides mesophilus]